MGGLIVSILVNLAKGVRRVVNVRRKAPEQSHTGTEYADALLFPEDDFPGGRFGILRPVASSIEPRPSLGVNRLSRNTPAPNA
jgi:hypothetical protein